MENYTKIIGQNIRKYRQSRKLTRESLAEALELDTAYLGQCERGERQLGLTKTIQVIRFFGISPNDLIPVNLPQDHQKKTQYLEELDLMLLDCSDNQLLAVKNAVAALLPFLKE